MFLYSEDSFLSIMHLKLCYTFRRLRRAISSEWKLDFEWRSSHFTDVSRNCWYCAKMQMRFKTVEMDRWYDRCVILIICSVNMYCILFDYNKGLSMKTSEVRRKEEFVQCGQAGGSRFFRLLRTSALFGEKKLRFFRNLWCNCMERGLSQCGQAGLTVSYSILCGRLL